MPLSAQLVNDLAHGAAYLFSDWPNSAVPTFEAGVYTIWHRDGRLVGMSGRGITSDTVHRNTPRGTSTASKATPVAEAVAISFVFT